MIDTLTWDSEFFGRRIGVLTGPVPAEREVAAELSAAADAGFMYVICRPPIDDLRAVRTLERAGFYLTDLGVTWSVSTEAYLLTADAGADGEIRLAGEDDVPALSARAATLFPLSRFYHDPFFAAEEADRLHAVWVANAVRGAAADAVWILPEAGFVTCRLAPGGGDVVLIGVYGERRGAGVGRRLMTAALAWFASRGVATVRVKTQVRNLPAMNFYRRLGFELHGADMTMGCVLRAEARDAGGRA
jgi:dTDP-4-amino-4,6-dideoxy-D-galactose acyltransferase